MLNTNLLNGIRILDLSRILAGPYTTMILGDLGANVIKVEPPNGDDTRLWAPFLNGESIYFMSINRNKRSIVIDLKKDEGREIVYKLTEKSDIFIENFRYGVTETLGIDYNSIKNIRKDIIYCSIKGFGNEGPYINKPAFDIILQAMSGLMATTGERNRPPVRVSFALVDIFAGLFAVASILSSLYRRMINGKGAHIEVSLYDSIIAAMSYVPMMYLMKGYKAPRMGSAHPSIVPYQAFRCRDGKYLIVAVGNDRHWKSLCNALNLENLINDPRFKTNPDRVKNRKILAPLLENIFIKKSRADWLKILEDAGVPTGPVYEIDEVFNDNYVRLSHLVDAINHPLLGPIKQILFPGKIDNVRIKPKRAPPTLGDSAKEILRELGYQDVVIDELISKGIVCCK